MGIQRLARALVRRGHDVTILQDTDAYSILSREGIPDDRQEAGDDGVNVIRVSSQAKYLSTLLTHQLGRPVVNRRAIRKILDNGNFDVINFHNISLVGGPGILSYGNAVKLYMAHEHWLICPTHVLWRHMREVCTERECLKCSWHYRRPPQLWRYTRYLERQLRHVDAFIAMSEFSRRKHHEFGFPRDMEVVSYFLPGRSFRNDGGAESCSPHKNPYILFVGRLERIKGLDDVIPVFNDFPDADLLIIGDGEYSEELRKIAAGNRSVHFLGRLPPEELDKFYRHAVALVVPSVCYETFGIILIEAFRQGTPVIARRIGPLPEIVERSGGGLLFDSPDELRDAMVAVLKDPALREKLAQSAMNGFDKYWSEDAVVPRYLDVIRRIAQAKDQPDILGKFSG